jgi:hypothetical protein
MGPAEFGFNLRDQAGDVVQPRCPGLIFEFFGHRSQGNSPKVRRASLDTVSCACKSGRVTGNQALIELGDSQRGVLEKNPGNLAQEFVVVPRVEGAEIFNGVRVDNGGIGHVGWC